jgi:hypothetical protein
MTALTFSGDVSMSVTSAYNFSQMTLPLSVYRWMLSLMLVVHISELFFPA